MDSTTNIHTRQLLSRFQESLKEYVADHYGEQDTHDWAANLIESSAALFVFAVNVGVDITEPWDPDLYRREILSAMIDDIYAASSTS